MCSAADTQIVVCSICRSDFIDYVCSGYLPVSHAGEVAAPARCWDLYIIWYILWYV